MKLHSIILSLLIFLACRSSFPLYKGHQRYETLEKQAINLSRRIEKLTKRNIYSMRRYKIRELINTLRDAKSLLKERNYPNRDRDRGRDRDNRSAPGCNFYGCWERGGGCNFNGCW